MTSSAPESPATRNVEDIARLEREQQEHRNIGERVGLAVANVVGTVTFAIAQVFFLLGWTVWNIAAPDGLRWDPYPFDLLTMIVSMKGVMVAA